MILTHHILLRSFGVICLLGLLSVRWGIYNIGSHISLHVVFLWTLWALWIRIIRVVLVVSLIHLMMGPAKILLLIRLVCYVVKSAWSLEGIHSRPLSHLSLLLKRLKVLLLLLLLVRQTVLIGRLSAINWCHIGLLLEARPWIHGIMMWLLLTYILSLWVLVHLGWV